MLENLLINNIVIHEIYKRESDKSITPPLYGDTLTKLERRGHQTLEERIINAMGRSLHSLEMTIEKTDESGLISLIIKLLGADDEDYIEISKRVADKLAEAQTSQNIPGGVLVIFKGTAGRDGKPCLGIIKAEIQTGFQKKSHGHLTIEFLSDLLLTPQQKLYKMGLFIQKNNKKKPSHEDFDTFVFDHNMTAKETRTAVFYFYGTFLGCSISSTDKKITQDFYNRTTDYIVYTQLNDDQKVDLSNALCIYLKTGNQETMSVNDFAEKYFTEFNLADEYKTKMREHSIPDRAFTGDIEYIKNKLKRRYMKFSSGAAITAQSEKFNDIVKVTEFNEDTNESTVIIKGRIKEME